MSGSSNNSWTIVTPEETAAETLRPLAQTAERQDEPSAPADGFGAKPSESAHGFSEEDQPTSEETVAKPNEDGDGTSLASSAPSEVQSPVPEAQTEDTPPVDTPPVDSGLCSTEPESFSDSYTHLGPSSEQTPAPALTADTLGRLDSGLEEATEQTDVQDQTQHQTVRQELQPEEEESKEETQQWSPIETPQDPTVRSAEVEPELRRRRRLAALEKIGRRDEEEEAEEDFQLPQRDEDSGITLNKCILGAVILLGLGTIFISGVVMDPDQENDYPPVELKNSESSGKPEWLNPDTSQPGAEAGSAELLNKLNKGTEQIEMLQAQLQSQHEELKEAKVQAAEGSAEPLEEVREENSRLMESVPVFQKELEKIRSELESVPVLHKEVETLRSNLTQLKFSAAATTPSSGRTENNSQRPEEVHKKEKHDRGVTKEWKDAEKSKWKKEQKQRKDGGKPEGKEKEWKREKSEGGKFEKRQKEDKHSKQSDETEGWKKSKRGDEGKPWKEKKEKKEWTYEGDKKHKHKNKERSQEESKYYQKKQKEPADKHWKKGRGGDKEEKEWIKEGDRKHKHDQFKEERSKKERDVKEGEYHQEKHKGPGDKHWKNGRDDHEDEGKEKYEKKHWKESDGSESRNRKDDGERREKSKDQKKWKRDDEKEWMNEAEERNGGKTYENEWHGDKTEKNKRKDQTWADEKAAQSKAAVGQPEYWARQRARLQHSSRPPHNCDSPDSCARAEGVRAVPWAEFESVLKVYLAKAQTAGVEASQIDALQKLAAEMFPNGVFSHDKMSFQDYVEDVEDILEDLVEGDDGIEQKDGAIEDEMEGFEEEVMQKFMLSKEGEVKEESERGRG